MKTSSVISVFIQARNRALVIREIDILLKKYIASYDEDSSASITYTEEDSSTKPSGFWVNITSDDPKFGGAVGSFVEGLSKSGVARYYELVLDYMISPNKTISGEAHKYALRGLGEPLVD